MSGDEWPSLFAQIAIQGGITALILRFLVGRPHRSKRRPERQRMPVLTLIVGWGCFAVAAVIALASLTVEETDERNRMVVFVISFLVVGAGFLLTYRNWFLAPVADQVTFRTIFGRERTIFYSDIVEYSPAQPAKDSRLKIRSRQGTTLAVNLTYYDMTPLLAAIRFKDRHGRWPVPGEPR